MPGAATTGADVCHERRFWYSYYCLAYRFDDDDMLSACLSVRSDAALAWWNDFTGWYDGVIDEADGMVDDPGRFELSLERGDVLVVEAHPGDLFLRRRAPGGEADELVANFGPHPIIPDWNLADVQAMAGSNPFAFLLLAPLVRLTAADQVTAAAVFGEACLRARLVDHHTASAELAARWMRSVGS